MVGGQLTAIATLLCLTLSTISFLLQTLLGTRERKYQIAIEISDFVRNVHSIYT